MSGCASSITLPAMTSLLLRPATSDDSDLVRRLAALDSARPLHGDVLLAFVGDRAVAAVSLLDGRLVADPFSDSADAADLLREHADGLRAGRGAHRRRSSGTGLRRPRLSFA
jgi:hypothetical protein